MNRARLLGGLLTVILLVCGAVIYLDQQGAFGDTAVSTPANPTSPTSDPATTGTETGTGDGYGDLR